MRKILSVILVLVWGLSACAQQQDIKLIVRGDDMGFSHSANHAIVDCWKNGIMTTVEIMVAVPWFPEAVKLCNENPDLDVGIHIALTSEWSNVKWRPLTGKSSITDEDGYFFPMIWPNKNYGEDQALKGTDWKIEDIEKELRAQIETAMRHIPRISHFTAHMGCTGMDEEVKALSKKLADEYGIAIFPEDMGVKRASYQGEKATAEQKIESFIAMLNGLEAGNTYLFVDHPGYDVEELRGVNHIGYNDVATDRAGVTTCWTSEQVKKVIAEKGIKLISYADLKKEVK
ncbi:MAG: hypothetical protein CMO01_05020 [Thalassobius sp.]|nr:hypothetical protein [Thalassovita sp.]